MAIACRIRKATRDRHLLLSQWNWVARSLANTASAGAQRLQLFLRLEDPVKISLILPYQAEPIGGHPSTQAFVFRALSTESQPDQGRSSAGQQACKSRAQHLHWTAQVTPVVKADFPTYCQIRSDAASVTVIHPAFTRC